MIIKGLRGRQVFDSRGNPTVEAHILLDNGISVHSSVPSGASTGTLEAYELRDHNKKILNGKTVHKAVQNINGEIADMLVGKSVLDQSLIDNLMINQDGTKNKSRLGANAILATSMCVAKAASTYLKIGQYRYFGGTFGSLLPVPLMNVINGGKHADNKLDFQEFMIAPVGGKTFSESLTIGAEIFHCLKKILQERGLNTNVGDEGGFAPDIDSVTEVLDTLCVAIEKSGFKPGKDVLIAMDVAASEFYDDRSKIYNMAGAGRTLSSDEMIDMYHMLVQNYPIFSIEDPLSEHDKTGFVNMTRLMTDSVQIVGDDLFVTNPEIISQGIKEGMCNALLVKPNQIGTITETMTAIDIAKQAGYGVILSHRSGETEDTTISHLAVGCRSGQIKTGSMSRTDRIAKYNELIRIEEELAFGALFAGEQIFARYSKYRENIAKEKFTSD